MEKEGRGGIEIDKGRCEEKLKFLGLRAGGLGPKGERETAKLEEEGKERGKFFISLGQKVGLADILTNE